MVRHPSRPEFVRMCVVFFRSSQKEEEEEEEEGEFGHGPEVVAAAWLVESREQNN